MVTWNDLSNADKATMLRDIEYTLTCGDDYNIHLSNASREVIGDSVDNLRLVSGVLNAAAKAADDLHQYSLRQSS